MSLPKPYYDDGGGRVIYHGDCRDILPELEPGSVDLVLTDPPYGKVVDAAWDHQWTNRKAMLAEVGGWLDLMVPTLAWNGTLYWFAWPSLAGRIESLIAERLNLLAHIVWIKPNPTTQKVSPELLRSPVPETERIIMAEPIGCDGRALGESRYASECDELRGFVFEPLRSYLASEMERAGFNNVKVNEAWRAWKGGKGGMSSHWFTQSQWALPTAENYEWLRGLFNAGSNGAGAEYLRREYEYLRREYEDLRRYFDCRKGDQATDVWRFGSDGECRSHPAQKPVTMIRYMERLSCRSNGLILDPFMGSGTTLVAAKQLGRRARGIEIEERYCEIAANRLAQEMLPFPEPPKPTCEQMELLP